MTKPLVRIGEKLALPALEVQTQTLVVYGGKGMGKTNLAAVLAEELARNHLRFSWIDPVGVAWGLKHSGDGRGPGVEVLILGGIHADIPINPAAGAVVADLVVDEDVSVIIDISRHTDGRMWTAGEKIRFVTAYCVRLFERQGERRRPIMQIIDEAGRFVPQDIPAKAVDIMECVGAIEQLVELGRNVGAGVALFTQRSARMRKSVSELAEMMIAFRTVGPRSIKAILDWFGEHVERPRQHELIERVRELDVGTALVVSPGWLKLEGEYKIRARQTFDSSSTPVAGKERAPRGKGAVVDLGKYRSRMAETIEAAKANDPKELQTKIRALTGQLEQAVRRAERAEQAQPVATAPERVPFEVSVLTDDDIGRLEDSIQEAHATVAELERIPAAIRAAADQVAAAVARVTIPNMNAVGKVGEAVARASRALPPAPVERRSERRPFPDFTDDEVKLKAGARRILETLARHHPGVLTIGQLGTLAKFRITGGTFKNYFGQLKRLDLIHVDGNNVSITDNGLDHIGHVPAAPQTAEEIREMWRGSLKAGARTMLDNLIDTYPQGMTVDELADAAGIAAAGGTFKNYLGTLRRNGLITVDQGQCRASDTLFIGAAA